MMPRSTLPACALALAALSFLPALLPGRGNGVTPGVMGIPQDLTRWFPGCGAPGCHASFPNSFGPVRVEILPEKTSLDLGSTIQVTLEALGGVANPPGFGGFCLEATAGIFHPRGNTDNGRTASFQLVPHILTHTNNSARRWQFSYEAPAVPGSVEWFAAANTVDNNGQASGDSWDWWQPPTRRGMPGIPFRLFVNAAGVSAFGEACPGSDRLAPVVGAEVPPQPGASAFAVHVLNVPAGAAAVVALGVSHTSFAGIPLPLDLAPLGAPGCALRVEVLVHQAALAPGNPAVPGSGRAVVPWPIPADPSLRGARVYFQALVLDRGANAAGLTTSAGLAVTIQ